MDQATRYKHKPKDPLYTPKMPQLTSPPLNHKNQ